MSKFVPFAWKLGRNQERFLELLSGKDSVPIRVMRGHFKMSDARFLELCYSLQHRGKILLKDEDIINVERQKASAAVQWLGQHQRSKAPNRVDFMGDEDWR